MEEFAERVAFAQGDSIDHAAVQTELTEMAARIETVISQSTFNGDSLLTGTDARVVVSGVTRDGGFAATELTFNEVDLSTDVHAELAAIITDAGGDAATRQGALEAAEGVLAVAIGHATSLGVAEKSIEVQQDFLKT